MKRPSKTSLINKNDTLFSNLIRSKGYCERCKQPNERVQLQCAHIYSRRYKGLRWDTENALSLCAGCHMWGHHRPVDFTDWIRETWPGRIESLRIKMAQVKTYTVHDYLGTREELKRQLEAV